MNLEQRTDYNLGELNEATTDLDPVVLLRLWLEQAEQADVAEPNAMALTTTDATGHPAARNVLLRSLDDAGHLIFYTNHNSHKGSEIAGNPNVCLLFSWLGLHRQVRVLGSAKQIPDQFSDEYFASRPRESQIGAWASLQSTVIADRSELDQLVADTTKRFEGLTVPRPPHWGGYSVRSTAFEFWQGRPSRLHDRLHYWRHADHWRRERLAP
ncbi:MAG: pyridoxamine 5'-phosphate oxidase [Microthrixaceae bacterium]